MMAAFVLGEVCQTESCQGEIGIGIFGVLVLCGIFLIERVAERNGMWMLFLEACGMLLFFCMGFFRMQSESRANMVDWFAEQREWVTAEGTLYKTGKTSYYNQYYLKDVVMVSETGERMKADAIQLSVKAETDELFEQTQLGNRIRTNGVPEIPERATNPGEFDWYLYYRAMGIRYQMKTERMEIIDRRTNWIREGLERCKRKLKSVYQDVCTDLDYGVFCAVLLGEKQELDAEVKSLYEENGISHILAISGLHISLIGMGLYHFLRKWFGFLPSQIAAGLFMAAYVLMTGAGVSSVRAYVMFLLLLTAATLGRTYDVAVSAGWIAFLLLVRNPYLIYYAGFLLSFGAIVGIGVVGSLLNRYVGSQNFAVKSMVSSMSVIWVTLPVSAYFFFTYAAWSIVLNLVVVPCMTLVMVSGIFGGVAGIWFPKLGMMGIGMGHYILCFYEKICGLAEHLPKHQVLIGRPEWWQIALYYGIVSAVCIWVDWQVGKQESKEENERCAAFLKQKERIWDRIVVCRKIVLLGAVLFLLIAVLCFRRSGRLEVIFLDVSQGDGIFFRLPSGATCLIDGGSSDIRKVGEYRILPFLQSQRVECLDFVFVSHADNDHISGIKELFESEECRIDTLCLPDIAEPDEAYQGLVEMAENAGSQVLYLKTGDRIAEEGLSISCVHPKGGLAWADRNAYSMTLWLRYGETDFLFTGDIGEEQEREILSLLPSDFEVLKAAHHGSRYSNSEMFLEQISPEYVVISCGEDNSYGHPHSDAVERIEECGAKIWMTKEVGAVIIVSDGKKVEIEGFLR